MKRVRTRSDEHQPSATRSDDDGGRYRGEFSWSSNPGSVTVKSSLGGSATRTVTLK